MSKRGMSSREMRRMAEREQSRESRKAALDAWWRLTPQERAQRIADNETFRQIQRNGITLEDVRNAEREAYNKGMEDGKNETIRMCFAAICLALNERHGFGKKRCAEVLNDTFDKLQFALTSYDAIQEVYDKIGLTIKFSADITENAVEEVGA